MNSQCLPLSEGGSVLLKAMVTWDASKGFVCNIFLCNVPWLWFGNTAQTYSRGFHTWLSPPSRPSCLTNSLLMMGPQHFQSSQRWITSFSNGQCKSFFLSVKLPEDAVTKNSKFCSGFWCLTDKVFYIFWRGLVTQKLLACTCCGCWETSQHKFAVTKLVWLGVVLLAPSSGKTADHGSRKTGVASVITNNEKFCVRLSKVVMKNWQSTRQHHLPTALLSSEWDAVIKLQMYLGKGIFLVSSLAAVLKSVMQCVSYCEQSRKKRDVSLTWPLRLCTLVLPLLLVLLEFKLLFSQCWFSHSVFFCCRTL